MTTIAELATRVRANIQQVIVGKTDDERLDRSDGHGVCTSWSRGFEFWREQTALAERATTLEESLQSKQLENRELAEKVGQVRSQIKNEKRLIELENQAPVGGLVEARDSAGTMLGYPRFLATVQQAATAGREDLA